MSVLCRRGRFPFIISTVFHCLSVLSSRRGITDAEIKVLNLMRIQSGRRLFLFTPVVN